MKYPIAAILFSTFTAVAFGQPAITRQTPASRQTMQATVMSVGSDTTIYPIHTKVDYTTIIILPQDDKILDYLVGDKSEWVLEGAENLAYIRPAEAGHNTNVNLVTAKGNVYTFDVDEVTNTPSVPVDEKVILRVPQHADLSSSSVAANTPKTPRFVSYNDFQKVQELAQHTATEAQVQIERDRQNVANAMHFSYKYKSGKPFNVASIYDDGKFTYIQMKPSTDEMPALYLIKDGKPDLTNYTYANGVYTVNSVIDHAYLRIGKAKLDITRNAK